MCADIERDIASIFSDQNEQANMPSMLVYMINGCVYIIHKFNSASQ